MVTDREREIAVITFALENIPIIFSYYSSFHRHIDSDVGIVVIVNSSDGERTHERKFVLTVVQFVPRTYP